MTKAPPRTNTTKSILASKAHGTRRTCKRFTQGPQSNMCRREVEKLCMVCFCFLLLFLLLLLWGMNPRSQFFCEFAICFFVLGVEGAPSPNDKNGSIRLPAWTPHEKTYSLGTPSWTHHKGLALFQGRETLDLHLCFAFRVMFLF